VHQLERVYVKRGRYVPAWATDGGDAVAIRSSEVVRIRPFGVPMHATTCAEWAARRRDWGMTAYV
jgi:hypothetical protein